MPHKFNADRRDKTPKQKRGVTNWAAYDLSPKFPPVLRGVLGIKSLALGRHLDHRLSLQKFHRCQVTQC